MLAPQAPKADGATPGLSVALARLTVARGIAARLGALAEDPGSGTGPHFWVL